MSEAAYDLSKKVLRLCRSCAERKDTEAIAYLTPVQGVDPVAEKKSLVHTLAFPDQEYKLKPGSEVRDAVDGNPVGDILEIDPAGRLLLKRGPKLADTPLPDALVANGPVPTTAQRQSLRRIGDALLRGDDCDRVGRDLLGRAVPRFVGLPPGTAIQTMDLEGQRALEQTPTPDWRVVTIAEPESTPGPLRGSRPTSLRGSRPTWQHSLHEQPDAMRCVATYLREALAATSHGAIGHRPSVR